MQSWQRKSHRWSPLVALAVALALLANGPTGRVDAAQQIGRFERASLDIGERMEAWQVPGLALVVVQGDQIIHMQGYGVADAGSGAPMTAETPLAIGSMTKGMTALAIMQLVQEGKADLDAPITRYLPWFALADARGARITLRQVLSNSAGLPPTAAFDGAQDAGALERRVRALAELPLCDEPGTAWQYANDGFNIAGLVIQAISGLSYEEYMRMRVFEPLGMSRTTFDPGRARQLGLAQGYARRLGRVLPVATPLSRGYNPAGMGVSTAHDVGNYLVALANGGQVNGGQAGGSSIISAASLETLWSPVVPAGDGSQYGLGWFIRPEGGVRLVNHPGGFVMGSMAIVAPEQRLAVAVFVNRDVEMKVEVAEEIMRGLLAGGDVAEHVTAVFDRVGRADVWAPAGTSESAGTAGLGRDGRLPLTLSDDEQPDPDVQMRMQLPGATAVHGADLACACFEEDSAGGGTGSDAPLVDAGIGHLWVTGRRHDSICSG